MSGRIRQLKPVVFLDEDLWALIEAHPDLHLLQAFEGLWCQSDREGRFEWRPAMLKSQILPYWGGDFARCLDALCRGGFIVRYQVSGRTYGQVRSFHRHQRPNNREPDSAIPPAPLEQTQVSLEHTQADDSCAHEPAAFVCESPRASLPPLPTPTPTPTPNSQPTHASTGATALHRERNVTDGARPVRVFTMPGPEPTSEYLDEAVMAGVSREQAVSTWRHYWTAGLPERGVEKLYPWLIKQAKERVNQLARAGPTRSSSREVPNQPNAGVTGLEKAIEY